MMIIMLVQSVVDFMISVLCEHIGFTEEIASIGQQAGMRLFVLCFLLCFAPCRNTTHSLFPGCLIVGFRCDLVSSTPPHSRSSHVRACCWSTDEMDHAY